MTATPAVINPPPLSAWQSPYSVRIRQLAPFTYEQSQQVEMAFDIVRE